MTRYAVGDIQGCLKPLKNLLKKVAFNPEQDQLWVVGDMVNRGPKSLQTLLFLRQLGPAVRIVLGNHDLHFLAIATGSTRQRSQDTLTELLQAPERDDLVDWLRRQPLLYTDPSGDYSMVHAGIPPPWTLAEAAARAAEVESILRSDRMGDFFDNMYGNYPDRWDPDLSGWGRYRLITNYFTRMRFCTRKGRLDLLNKSNVPGSAKFAPWFAHRNRATRHERIIFGHWASLEGKVSEEGVYALDTGCVWGGRLTLFDMDNHRFHQCACK